MPALLPHAPAASLRVLAVVPGNGQGSSFIFARRQIASLANVDVNVRTFFLGSRTSPIAIARDWTRVRREIRQFHPHLIHAHYGTLTSFLCAVVTAIPLIITFRGNDLGDDPDVSLLRSRLGQLLSQASCLKAKQIICVSRRLRERLWWHRRRAVVIPSGVDMNVFCPQSSEQARTSLGWKKDERVVIFDEGRAPERKGLKFVQSAVRLAEAKVGPIRLAILDRSVAPDVVPCYLNASDCLALASVFEGSPNIVKEALACNLPVVSTDVGDVSERLSGVIPSKVVKRDPVEFANALAEVLLERRRSNGREMVEICSVPRVAAAIRSVYESSLAIPQEFSALDGVAQG
ncbi:MAG: glycosyltransferase [Acidobacteria bacterium]|nr:glycosyltransferase [Acidobacteriota bacterium]